MPDLRPASPGLSGMTAFAANLQAIALHPVSASDSSDPFRSQRRNAHRQNARFIKKCSCEINSACAISER